MPDLIRIGDLDRHAITAILDRADAMEHDTGARPDLRGMAVALLFLSDSLRTRVGFELAAARGGAATTLIQAQRRTPEMAWAESVEDAVRSIAGWCDAICLRSPDASDVDRAVAVVDTAVVNCGNGTDEHPTQTLIDLDAIRRLRGRIDGARVAIVGNLHSMRVAHSLVKGLASFDGVHVVAIAPSGLELPTELRAEVSARLVIEETTELAIEDADVVYVAGLPRTDRIDLTDDVRHSLTVGPDALARLRPDAHVLCPLPRLDEIDPAIDDAPQAAYFTQSAWGMAVRMAVLGQVLDR